MIFQNAKTLLFGGLIGTILILSASSNLVSDITSNSTVALIDNIQYVEPNYVLSVSYSVDGTNYNGTLTLNSTNNKVGDYIEIDYQKNNYNNIVLHTNKTKTAIYSSLGGIVFLILSYFAYIQLNKEVRDAEKLFE
jgi:hypothetical protein